MKPSCISFRPFLILLVIFSLLISACGPQGKNKNEVILPPGDPNNTNLVTGVDNGKTLDQKYVDCVQSAKANAAWVITTQIDNEPVVITGCKQLSDETNIMLIPALYLTKVIPGQADDAAVVGTFVVKNIIFAIVTVGSAVIAGQAIHIQLQQLNNTEALVAASKAAREVSLAFTPIPENQIRAQTKEGIVFWYANSTTAKDKKGKCFGGIQTETIQLATQLDMPCPEASPQGVSYFLKKFWESFVRDPFYNLIELAKDSPEAIEAVKAIAKTYGQTLLP